MAYWGLGRVETPRTYQKDMARVKESFKDRY